MSDLNAVVSGRLWRVTEGFDRRLLIGGLLSLFERYQSGRLSSYEARGLVEGIVLAAGRNDVMRNDENGRDMRRAIVAFLTDVGAEQSDGIATGIITEPDPEVRRTARRTLAQHVCPIIAANRRTSRDTAAEPEPMIFDLYPEHLETLTTLVQFYEASARSGSLARYDHENLVQELSGKHLQNVRECMSRVYRELRRHLILEDGETYRARDAMHRLNRILVDRRWWDVLAQVRALSAIELLYSMASHLTYIPRIGPQVFTDVTPGFANINLQFDWQGIEHHWRQGGFRGRFVDHAFIAERRDAILHDLCAIQAVAGGAFDPLYDETYRAPRGHTKDVGGCRPLLLDLTATFVREVEIAHPGVLIGR